MIVYSKIGESSQQIGGALREGYIVMDGERPSNIHEASSDGTWVVSESALFRHFTSIVDATITAKIQAYNEANSVAFANADAFTKYAINTSSQHHAIANQFITWIDNLWATARQYQATATEVPTDVEFQAVLDAVVF